MSQDSHESRPIDVQLSNASQQEEARKCLLMMLSAVQFLARLGLSFRGRDDDEKNFNHLLKYKSENDPSLSKWLSLKTDYTCLQIQNEILNLFSNYIIREIIIHFRPCSFVSSWMVPKIYQERNSNQSA